MSILSCPKPRVRNSCLVCSEIFESGRPSKYCGRKCRDTARIANAGIPCSGCSKPMFPSTSAAPGKSMCQACRRGKHGTLAAYSRGCRCDVCCSVKSVSMKSYTDGYRAKHGESPSTTTRRRFREEYGYWPNTRGSDWISSKLRLEIYERDGWICHLCSKQVDRDGDPNGNHAPSLDHLLPRAHGGSDDPSNLKTACRSCNSRKGAGLDYSATV